MKERLDDSDSKIGDITLLETSDKSSLVNALNENTIHLNDVRSKVPNYYGNIAFEEHPLANNPVLTKDNITDVSNVRFVADPFVVFENGVYHLFFEVEDGIIGRIGHATSIDGINWTYDRIVLDDGKHFAFPNVFKLDGEWYMLPDRGNQVPGLALYKANNFPYDWVIDAWLFDSGSFVDTVPVFWQGTWYLFSYDTALQGTRLYYADQLKTTNSWTEHPLSPIFLGLHVRPGGAPIVTEDFIDIFIQDGTNGIYGEKLWMYRITNLSKTTITTTKIEKPILQASRNGLWNSLGMHTINIVPSNRNSLPIVIADGQDANDSWKIGVFTVGTRINPPFLRAVKNTDQTITNNEWNKINFDLILNDTYQSYDSANQKYIIPETGYYNVSISICASIVNPTNQVFVANLRLKVNGLEKRTSPKFGQGASFSIPQTFLFNDVIPLSKGDQLEIEFYQNSGASQSVLKQGWSTFFTVMKLK
ncbi:MAG: hypothetical protein IRZ03_19345 [Acidobacterium ailaaui]|nr:hypothetical protein [Pseudacidobacterium ailaaui]